MAAPSTRRCAGSLERSSPTRRHTLARSAASVGSATITSRILGVARDQLLASIFGAGNAMDAFNVAFRVPNLLRDLFAEGAMSAAFVPVFLRQLATGDRDSAWRLGNNVINALLVVTGTLVVIGILFARPLIGLFASDYANVPGKLELTVFLTRIMLPFLTLIALAAALMGMLNSLHRFFLPALAPAMFNIATILCALLLVPVMPRVGLPPITAIAIGALIGGLAQIALQWPLLRREGFAYVPFLDWSEPGLRRVLMLMGPGTIGLAATQINVFVNTVLATSEGTGAVSWLNYAFRLMYLPTGLFGVSIATATVPVVSRHAARDEVAAVRSTLAEGLSLMLVLNVPGDCGPDRPIPSNRSRYLRAPRVPPLRHGSHRRRAPVLRGRAAGLLRRENRIAHLVRHGRQSHARPNQHRVRPRQRGAECRARPRHGLSRPCARHIHRRALQRGRAAVAAPLPARWA